MALKHSFCKTGSHFIKLGVAVIHVRLWESVCMAHASPTLQFNPLITVRGLDSGPESTWD
eukprot:12429445-Karenia_brevis.AAC.1